MKKPSVGTSRVRSLDDRELLAIEGGLWSWQNRYPKIAKTLFEAKPPQKYSESDLYPGLGTQADNSTPLFR